MYECVTNSRKCGILFISHSIYTESKLIINNFLVTTWLIYRLECSMSLCMHSYISLLTLNKYTLLFYHDNDHKVNPCIIYYCKNQCELFQSVTWLFRLYLIKTILILLKYFILWDEYIQFGEYINIANLMMLY